MTKRLWRTTLSPTLAPAEAFRDFKNAFLEKFFPVDDVSVCGIDYTDTELMESFVLDETTWEDFAAQEKKCINVHLASRKLHQPSSDDKHRHCSEPVGGTDVFSATEVPCVPSPEESLESLLVTCECNLLYATADVVSTISELRPAQVCPTVVDWSYLQNIVTCRIHSVNDVLAKWIPKMQLPKILQQQDRPLFIQFDNAQYLKTDSELSKKCHLQESTFASKYAHPSAKPLRKHIDKLINDFKSYDWGAENEVCADPRGKSQDFVQSVYRYIENELLALGLFDNTKSQGGGVPHMGEEQIQDLQIHIENLVLSQLHEYIIKYAPLSDVPIFHQQKLLYATAPNFVPVNLKFAYLGSFLSLDNFGFRPIKPEKEKWQHLLCSAKGNFNCEWRLACCLLHDACNQVTPNKIMRAFTDAIKMLQCCLDGLIRRRRKKCKELLNSLLGGCASKRAISYAVRRVTEDEERLDDDAISADDLLPAISYLVVMANPPQLWLCSEFRHESLRMGEDAYMLAQLTSAFEFCKDARENDFDISPTDFRCDIC